MKSINVKIICVCLSFIMCLQTFSVITFAQKPLKEKSLNQAETPAYAVEEVKSKREANVKHFRMSDGTYTAASYDAPVHYNDGGVWRDIDNTLAETTDIEENTAVYGNTDNPLKVKFAKKSNGKNILKLQNGEYKLMFSLLGDRSKNVEAQKTAVKEDGDITTLENTESRIIYENIFDNVDIEYVISGTKLKENIVIRKKLNDYTFKYEIKANGLTMSLENNAVIAKDNDKTVFCIPAPYMFDADGEVSDAVTYSLEKSNGNKYILTITADKDWINNAHRKFPVTVDPTVQIPEIDNNTFYYAIERNNEITHYDYGVGHINNALRYSNLSNSQSTATSLYMKVDLPYLDRFLSWYEDPPNSVAHGAKVVNAKLNLAYDATVYAGSESDDAVYAVYRNTSTWQSNFTFSNRPSKAYNIEDYLEKDTWDIVSYNPSTGQQTGVEKQPIFTADITHLVNDWYTGAEENNGIYITPSIESVGLTDIGHRIYYHHSVIYPRLSVSYICSVGLEDYFSYTTTDLDGLATGYVNNLTGSLNFAFTDHASANNRNGVSISHMYNDEFTRYDHLVIDDVDQVNHVGHGFKLNIQQTVFYDTAEDIWIHMDADGTYHYYYPEKESYAEDELIVYINEEGLGSKLIPDEEESLESCTITYKSGTKYIFKQELLKEITDKNNNTIEIVYQYSSIGYGYYPVQVKEILNDNESRITTLEWTGNGNKLSKLTAPDGSVVTYTYDNIDEYLLKEITFSSSGSYNSSGAGANTKLSLTYTTVDGTKVLDTATNSATNRTIEFIRNAGGMRVSYIESLKENAAVERTKFTYKPFSTEVSDELADYYIVKYIFNKQGQTAYVTDSEGNSKKYEYSEKHSSKNKINFESNLRRVPGNLLKNGNFQTKSLKYWSYRGASYDNLKQMVQLYDGEYISQQVYISMQGYYTLSAVIDNYDADIVMRIENSNGRLVKQLKVGPTDGPETKQLTANLTAGTYVVRIRSEYKGCYIKSVQMTRGTTAEEFNLLSNSDFNDGATGWKKTGFVDTDDLIGSYCEIVGDYRTKKMLSQTVDVDDTADTVYVFGAMVTSDCLPNKDNGDGTDTSVAITLELDYGNGEKDYKTVFCEPKTGTEFINLFGTVKTPYNVDKLTIYLKNLYNYGVAKFDDVYIFRDSAGIYYNYDNDGNLNYKQSESGAASNAVYDENGDIISSTDKRNLTTLYEYDSNRNLISTESPTGIFSINDYDSYGNVTSSRLSKMGKTLESGSSTYDTNGMYVTQTTDEFGHATDYTVNPDTLKTQEVKYGKPSASSDRFNYRVKYNYYENPKAGGGSMDGAGPVSSIYAYYEGNYESAAGVSFEYNKGEISKIKRGGYNYEFTKDYGGGTEYVNEGMTGLAYNFRTTTRINNSLDIGKTLYDAGGNLTATVYGNKNYHTYDRDVLGRLTAKNTLRDKLSYTYNSKGLPANVSSEYNNTTNLYSYDFAGRMSVSEFYDYSSDVSLKHKYTYDASDMLTGVKSVFTKEDGQRDVKYTTYEYDNEGRITEQDIYKEGSGSIYLVPKIRYNYNDVGLLTSTVYSGANQVNLNTPITRGITYKTIEGNSNRLSALIDTFDGYSYTYDNVGNIKSVSGAYINSATYIYDEANQVVKASGYYDTEQFEYDCNGNITKYHNVYSEQGYTNEYEYTYNYDSTWKDRLSSITSDSGKTVRAYTYGDQYSAGSTLPTSDGRFNYEWDGRMLTRATRISDYTVIDYKYDADGRRIEKKVTNGDGIVQKLTKYYYTDGALTTEVNYTPNNGTMTAETKVDYIYDNTGLAFVMAELYNNDNYYVSAGKYTFYVKRNAQGDVTSLIDITNGNMGDGIQYTYSAYGRMYIENTAADLGMLISDVNTLTFKSYSYDSDLGMYYLGSRWYDPEVCRFINADSYVSTGQGIIGYNMFAYCGNNPINRVDSNGQFWGVVGFLLIVGGVLFGTSSCSKSTPVRSDLQEKHRLDINTADPTEYNCYGNATQKLVNTNPTGYQRGDSTAKTFEAVKKDLGGDRNVRKLDSIDDTIREDEYKVAMRTGPTDYHFIRLTEDGWYNKPGLGEGTYVDESYVLSDVWYSMYTHNAGSKDVIYYDGEIIFFAVKIWWDAA